MAIIIIDESEGDNLPFSVNQVDRKLRTGIEQTVDDALLEAVENSGLLYTRVWRTAPVELGALGFDTAMVSPSIGITEVAGAITGSQPGSTLTLSDDADGRFSISGTSLIVEDTLEVGEYEIVVVETNSDIINSPQSSPIEITVADAELWPQPTFDGTDGLTLNGWIIAGGAADSNAQDGIMVGTPTSPLEPGDYDYEFTGISGNDQLLLFVGTAGNLVSISDNGTVTGTISVADASDQYIGLKDQNAAGVIIEGFSLQRAVA